VTRSIALVFIIADAGGLVEARLNAKLLGRVAGRGHE
jgi:hypothetical protein